MPGSAAAKTNTSERARRDAQSRGNGDGAGKPTGRTIDQPVYKSKQLPVDMRDLKAQAEPIFEEMQWMPRGAASSAGYAAGKDFEGDDFIPAWAAEKGLVA
jgi:hypothetical protein